MISALNDDLGNEKKKEIALEISSFLLVTADF